MSVVKFVHLVSRRERSNMLLMSGCSPGHFRACFKIDGKIYQIFIAMTFSTFDCWHLNIQSVSMRTNLFWLFMFPLGRKMTTVAIGVAFVLNHSSTKSWQFMLWKHHYWKFLRLTTDCILGTEYSPKRHHEICLFNGSFVSLMKEHIIPYRNGLPSDLLFLKFFFW